MNNENEIERMAKIVYNNYLDSRTCARELSAQGYGDKKQAVKEFAEILHSYSYNIVDDYGNKTEVIDLKKIDNLITELYGEKS